MNNKFRAFLFIGLVIGVLAFCACNQASSDIVRNVERIKYLLDETKTSKLANLSFVEVLDLGGTPITYITANTLDPATLPKLLWEALPQENSIVIRRSDKADELIIEGYGNDLTHPAIKTLVTEVGSYKP